jgi:hypothetical protein
MDATTMHTSASLCADVGFGPARRARRDGRSGRWLAAGCARSLCRAAVAPENVGRGGHGASADYTHHAPRPLGPASREAAWATRVEHHRCSGHPRGRQDGGAPGFGAMRLAGPRIWEPPTDSVRPTRRAVECSVEHTDAASPDPRCRRGHPARGPAPLPVNGALAHPANGTSAATIGRTAAEIRSGRRSSLQQRPVMIASSVSSTQAA